MTTLVSEYNKAQKNLLIGGTHDVFVNQYLNGFEETQMYTHSNLGPNPRPYDSLHSRLLSLKSDSKLQFQFA